MRRYTLSNQAANRFDKENVAKVVGATSIEDRDEWSTTFESCKGRVCPPILKFWILSLRPILIRRTINIFRTSRYIITFRVSRRRREMYCGHTRLCVCVSVCLSAAACPHYCTDQDVTWGSGRRCLLVVHCWADLQSVHGLRCYGNITRTRNVSEYVLVLALCLVVFCRTLSLSTLCSRL